MAYTFGAGTGDDITWGTSVTNAASGSAMLVCGWWYPTTLTATRGLWSAGNTVGAEIDTTTSELMLRTDNTTDGQWTTTGAGLATNQWTFLAFFLTVLNTGPAAAWRVWAGTLGSPPVELTVTNAVAPVGNFTGNANLYIGNKGTGTLAFQGDIGDIGYITSTGTISPTAKVFGINAYGACTNTESQFIFDRFVIPAWLGNGWAEVGIRRSTIPSEEYGYACTTNLFQIRRSSGDSGTLFSGVTPTINGATWSQNGSPRALIPASPYLPSVRR